MRSWVCVFEKNLGVHKHSEKNMKPGHKKTSETRVPLSQVHVGHVSGFWMFV